jgi:uncharacterized circularly permuted ATP-grasp superfamily protein
MLEDRKMMMRLFPDLFALQPRRLGRALPDLLLENLASVAPHGVAQPRVVLLTPGQHNSAYFEHAFLAQQMGIELVEGQDLFVRRRGSLHAHARGPRARRRHLPPHRRRLPRPARVPPDSSLGVPGLLSGYRAGRVTLPTPSAPASPTTSRSIRTCRT